MAALRAAAPRLPGRRAAAAEGRRRRNRTPAAAGDRDAQDAEADRIARAAQAASRGARARGRRGARTRDAAGSAGEVDRRAAVTNMTAPAWRTTLRRRIGTVVCVLGLWVAGIEARLVYLQVVSHADLLARAERQQKRTQDMPAKRGDILDRRGRVLATSVDADSIYAVPTEISNPE